jgi:hypothetical protein
MADYKKLMEMASDKKPEMDHKAKAKLKVLMDLKKMAADMMGEDIESGIKKVTVASPDKEGLKEGLEKAEELLGESEESDDMEDMMSDEDSMEDEEDDLMSIEAKIAELMKKKEMLASRGE